MSNATVGQTEDGELSDGELPSEDEENLPDSKELSSSYALFSSSSQKSKGTRQTFFFREFCKLMNMNWILMNRLFDFYFEIVSIFEPRERPVVFLNVWWRDGAREHESESKIEKNDLVERFYRTEKVSGALYITEPHFKSLDQLAFQMWKLNLNVHQLWWIIDHLVGHTRTRKNDIEILFKKPRSKNHHWVHLWKKSIFDFHQI